MSNEIKEKEEYEKYARDHRKELDAQEVRLGDVVTVLVGQFAGEKGVIVGISACHNDYSDPYYEVDMNCEVPEKYKCRKTLISPNNVIGGLSAHEFEVIGNCAPKQPSMEIKQGDKVRVSKDAPKMYLRGFDHIFTGVESVVSEVEDDNAVIIFNTDHINSQTTIPTKYLVKVEAEAKEAKFKVGDVVRIKPTADKLHQGYQNGYAWLPERDEYLGRVASVKEIWCDGSIILNIRNNMLWEPIDLELYTEPTEQTEAEKTNTDSLVAEINKVIEGYCKAFADIADSFDWQHYEADLAKEVALKVANKYNDPEQAAEYATDVAKAIVEGLKRK